MAKILWVLWYWWYFCFEKCKHYQQASSTRTQKKLKTIQILGHHTSTYKVCTLRCVKLVASHLRERSKTCNFWLSHLYKVLMHKHFHMRNGARASGGVRVQTAVSWAGVLVIYFNLPDLRGVFMHPSPPDCLDIARLLWLASSCDKSGSCLWITVTVVHLSHSICPASWSQGNVHHLGTCRGSSHCLQPLKRGQHCWVGTERVTSYCLLCHYSCARQHIT